MAAPRKVKAQISQIKKFENGVTWYRLIPDNPCRFRSGQFLHLALDSYDPSFNWPDSRAFSIANSPGRKNLIEILVSPKGAFTTKMVDTLKVGDTVWLKLPFGDFNFSNAHNANVILVAGGTGISPFIPFLEESLSYKTDYQSLTLYYGVSQSELIVFTDLLEKAISELQSFKLKLYIENGGEGEVLKNEIGILPTESIIKETKELNNAVYYLSGPKAMINNFMDNSKKHGIEKKQIFFDKWE